LEQVFLRKLLLNSTAVCAVGLTGLLAGPALAQSDPTPTATAPVEAMAGEVMEQNAEGQNVNEVQEVVVTGSRIPQPNLTSVSPVTVIGSQEVKLQGITRAEDLVNQLPQVFSSQGSTISNGASGRPRSTCAA
jgi:outer membrane receptor protein involved in Fe transport